MLSEPPASDESWEIAAASAPRGALLLCSIAVFIVFGLWLAFYLFAFLPRGLLQ